MQAKWNTGRLYTTKGQRLAAELKDNTVTFVDVDRGISGMFEVVVPPPNEHMLRMAVMERYDYNQYKSYGTDYDTIRRLSELAATLG